MEHRCGSACPTRHLICRGKARKHKSGGYKTILDRWHDDDRYRKSLSDIGWTEEKIIQYDAIASEDHSYVTTWQERSRNEKSRNISLNAEGIQGPLNQRSDFKEALGNKSGKGLINKLKALKNTITHLKLVQDGDTNFLARRIRLRHHTGNQAATGSQLGSGFGGKRHPGLNSKFLFL